MAIRWTHPSSNIRSAQYRALRPKAPAKDPAVICIQTPVWTSLLMTSYRDGTHDSRSGWVRIGDVARDHQIEEKILELRRRRMVRRLDQHVARIGNGQETAGSEPRDEIGGHMDVRAGDKLQRNPFLIESCLKLLDGEPDVRPGIMIEARQNMWGASNGRYPLPGHRLCHGQRYGQIARAVVDPGQDVAMKVDQGS